jgi:hypothetical protein
VDKCKNQENVEFQNVVAELVAFFSDEESQEHFFWQVEMASVERHRADSGPKLPVLKRHDAFLKLTADEPLDDDDRAFLIELIQFPHRFVTFNPLIAQHRNGRFRGELLVAMLMAREFGLQPFRNDTSAETSACDAVAAAFKIVGFRPTSYSGVKSIYLKNAWNTDTELRLNGNYPVD